MTTQPNNIHNLPAHLKKMNRWLAWSLVPDGDRLKKIPINIRSGGFLGCSAVGNPGGF
jgi:primase-polymerase (primpol)-like protein